MTPSLCVIDKEIMVLALHMTSWCAKEGEDRIIKLFITSVLSVNSSSRRLMAITFITLITVNKVKIVEN